MTPPQQTLLIDRIKYLMEQVAHLESVATRARLTGNELGAKQCFLGALGLALQAVDCAIKGSFVIRKMEILKIAAELAMGCGEVAQARDLISQIPATNTPNDFSNPWKPILTPVNFRVLNNHYS